MDDLLTPTAVSPHLHTRWLGHSYHYLPTIGSTNSYLKEKTSLPHGTVALTNFQEAGRGRFDRTWQAPPNSALLFSILLHPNWSAERVAWLGMIAALATCDAIATCTGLDARLKWPNDLVLWHQGGWRKISGLLLEAEWEANNGWANNGWANGRLASAIIGIGINVNLAPADLPPMAASLQSASGQPIARRPLLCHLLQQFEQRYEAAEQGESPQQEWESKLMTLGQRVIVTAVHTNTLPIEGIAEATDNWGQLLVRDASGNLHPVAAGDVTLRQTLS